MLRTPYSAGIRRPKPHRAAALLITTLLLPACSMSVPGFGGDDGPETTGSIAAAPVEVAGPLPETLAYSDATKIGQAADAALWQAGAASDNGGWVNASTGSSGSVTPGVEGEGAEVSAACRSFNTLVTSIGGVHSYSGRICRGEAGGSVVEIAAPTPLPEPG